MVFSFMPPGVGAEAEGGEAAREPAVEGELLLTVGIAAGRGRSSTGVVRTGAAPGRARRLEAITGFRGDAIVLGRFRAGTLARQLG